MGWTKGNLRKLLMWKQNFKLIDQLHFVFYPSHFGTQKPGLTSTLRKVEHTSIHPSKSSVICYCAFVSIMKTLPLDVLRDSHLVYRCEPRDIRDTSRGCVTVSRHAWLGPASDNAEANWCNPLVIIVITQYHHNSNTDGVLTLHWSNTHLLM